MISNYLLEIAKHDGEGIIPTYTYADVAGKYYNYENGEKKKNEAGFY